MHVIGGVRPTVSVSADTERGLRAGELHWPPPLNCRAGTQREAAATPRPPDPPTDFGRARRRCSSGRADRVRARAGMEVKGRTERRCAA